MVPTRYTDRQSGARFPSLMGLRDLACLHPGVGRSRPINIVAGGAATVIVHADPNQVQSERQHRSPAEVVSEPRPSVLISAYACFPGHGSEPEVGWRWVLAAADVAEVVALVRDDCMPAIRAYERDHGAHPRITWIPLQGPFSMAGRNQRGNLIHIHYNAWQVAALRAARRIIAERRIDLVHHVTYVTFTYPSLLWACGRPFIFGPVAGADSIPRRLLGVLSPRARLREHLKRARDALVALNPLTALAVTRAARVVAVNGDNARFLRRHFGVDPTVRPALVLPQLPAADPSDDARGERLLYVGALLEWKGLALLLGALRRCREAGQVVALEICGDGPQRGRLQHLAAGLGVSDQITWHGHLPRAALAQRYRSARALCFPSLRDSGGFVLVEALAHGCPIICLDRGGASQIALRPGGGQRVPIVDRERTERGLAAAISQAMAGAFHSESARASVEDFTQVGLRRFLEGLYREVLGATGPRSGPARTRSG